MRIVAIDSGASCGAAVGSSVETVARTLRQAGAEVIHVHLDRLKIRHCRGCGRCAAGGTCRIEDDVLSIARFISGADGVVLGTHSHFGRPDAPTEALLSRLPALLPDVGDEAAAPAGRPMPRAVVVVGSVVPRPFERLLGLAEERGRRVRAMLAARGVSVIGTLPIADTWRSPNGGISTKGRATALGRRMAETISRTDTVEPWTPESFASVWAQEPAVATRPALLPVQHVPGPGYVAAGASASSRSMTRRPGSSARPVTSAAASL
jgi:hypothetical protein